MMILMLVLFELVLYLIASAFVGPMRGKEEHEVNDERVLIPRYKLN